MRLSAESRGAGVEIPETLEAFEAARGGQHHDGGGGTGASAGCQISRQTGEEPAQGGMNRLVLLRLGTLGRWLSVRHVVIVLALALASCGAVASGPAATPVPDSVTALIHNIESQPVRNPPAIVARYDYAGQVVYYVPPHCCDFFGDLYDSTGQVICHPEGGLTGKGDGRCPDFFTQRQHETIIWRDSRKG